MSNGLCPCKDCNEKTCKWCGDTLHELTAKEVCQEYIDTLESKLSQAREEIETGKQDRVQMGYEILNFRSKINRLEELCRERLAKLSKAEEEIEKYAECINGHKNPKWTCVPCGSDVLKEMQAKLSKLERVRVAAKSIADNCPYNLDEASVPKDRNLELPQVVGNWSVAWLRRKELIAALRETEER